MFARMVGQSVWAKKLSLEGTPCLQGWTDKECVGNILSLDGATRKIQRTPKSDM